MKIQKCIGAARIPKVFIILSFDFNWIWMNPCLVIFSLHERLSLANWNQDNSRKCKGIKHGRKDSACITSLRLRLRISSALFHWFSYKMKVLSSFVNFGANISMCLITILSFNITNPQFRRGFKENLKNTRKILTRIDQSSESLVRSRNSLNY